MTPWPPFRLTDTPLAEGVWLIQASAGTGKTFTIAGLFLRLILERDFPVRDLLVVTFTEAATGELRDRIRRTLADARRVLDGGAPENPAVPDILRRAALPAEAARARLERALRTFDEAPIHTIHSFCQRALKDRAFESGQLFDTELLTDDADLLQQVADDFWRRRFYGADLLVVSCLLKNNRSPEHFAAVLRLHSRHPELRVISAVDGRSLEVLIAELTAAFDAARQLWHSQREDILAALGLESAPSGGEAPPQAPAWAKNEHAKPELIATALADLERCFSAAGPTPDALGSLKFFTNDQLREDTRVKKVTPSHPFFDRCAEVLAAEQNLLVGVELDFLEFGRAELPRRKHELKVQCFDDLLTRLRDALRTERGPALAAELRSRYRAALIDEFQDTDPVQWEIFRTLFSPKGPGGAECWSDGVMGPQTNPSLHHATTPCPGTPIPFLFLIGDPKQAIFGFRGADIFTYLDAARGVEPGHGFTLDRNWRSESPLVAAVNTFFGASNPFAFDEIQFQPVTPAGQADGEPLREGERMLPPLRLWFAPRGPDQKDIPKEDAEHVLPPLVAGEIVRLLNGDTRLGSRRLAPRDIAVLVLENRQAALLQEALRHAGVPSVLHTEASVFASREARELERVLAALAQPGHERALRAALATDLLGLNGTMLDALLRDGAAWEARLERFRALHALWNGRGFMPMFRQWLHAEEVRPRLLGFDDGERRLTNLLHLAEVLHAAAHEQRLGAAGLVRWLEEQVSSAERAREEHQLRLERDDEAVRLVTIHKSKGLEYPIVFCPFAWRASDIKRGREDQVFFHERSEEAGGLSQFVHDLGSPQYEAHRQLAFHEKLMENLRLLYVALTRARNRCYFVWGAFKGAETSAAAWLLHPPPITLPERRPPTRRDPGAAQGAGAETVAPVPDLKAAMTTHFKSLDDGALRRGLEQLVERSARSVASAIIQIEDLPQPTSARYLPPNLPATELTPRQFLRPISTRWRITSFSGLIADRGDESPDRDPEEPVVAIEPEAEPAAATGLFAFPRGTQAGTCLHKIFEELDFSRAAEDATLNPLLESNLRLHGIGLQFAGAVRTAVRQALAVPLDAAQPDFTLSRVPAAERMNELEFCLPVRELTPALLRAGLAAAGGDVAARLGALGFRPSEGFIRGFIDLAFRREGRFYIVDWKSNWLGNRAEDYGPGALRAEMVRRFYVLQYHLYTLALHEQLKLRLPGYRYDEHFGGVYYLFLRGVDPARPELGVFRDRPAVATVEQLSRALLAKPEGIIPLSSGGPL